MEIFLSLVLINFCMDGEQAKRRTSSFQSRRVFEMALNWPSRWVLKEAFLELLVRG